MSSYDGDDWVGALGLLAGLGLLIAGMYGAWQGWLPVSTLCLLAVSLVVSFVPLFYAVQLVVGQGPPVATGLMFLASRWGVMVVLSLGLQLLLGMLLGAAGQFVASLLAFVSWVGISAFLAKAMWCDTIWSGMKIALAELGIGICALGCLFVLALFFGPLVSMGVAALGFLAFWFMGYE